MGVHYGYRPSGNNLFGNGLFQSTPGSSALAIKNMTGTNTNGFYWINLGNGQGSSLVYCIMDSAVDGGGWMVLYGTPSGATSYTYGFSAERQDVSVSPLVGNYSLSAANRSGVNAVCTENKTLIYNGNSNWMRFDGYLWNSSTQSSGNFRYEFNSSMVTSDGTTDTTISVGTTNYGVTNGGDLGVVTIINGFDHHNPTGYYDLNGGCGNMYLYQYASGYKVNTTLSGWYATSAGCAGGDSNQLAFLVAMK